MADALTYVQNFITNNNFFKTGLDEFVVLLVFSENNVLFILNSCNVESGLFHEIFCHAL
jgi:hypothetical protein